MLSLDKLFCLTVLCVAAGALLVPSTSFANDKELLVLTVDGESGESLQPDILEFQRVVLDKGDFWFAGSQDMTVLLTECEGVVGDDEAQRECHLRAAGGIGVAQVLRLTGSRLDDGRFTVELEVWSSSSAERVWTASQEVKASSLAVAARKAYPRLALDYVCWRGVESACTATSDASRDEAAAD